MRYASRYSSKSLACFAACAWLAFAAFYFHQKRQARLLELDTLMEGNALQLPLDQSFANLCKGMAAMDEMTPKQRRDLIGNTAAARERLSNLLTEKLMSETGRSQCFAAYLLGLYHLEASTPMLVNKIAIEDRPGDREDAFDFNGPGSSLWFWGKYPAAEALVNIGSHALGAVTRRLEKGSDKETRMLSLWVIYRVTQDDKEATQRILKKALNQAKDPIGRHNLQWGIDYIKVQEPKFSKWALTH